MTPAPANKYNLTDASSIIPDIRASLCHSILAAGFLLINLQNPFRERFIETWIEAIVMLGLPLAVGLSWSMFVRRFRMWQQFSDDQRSTLTRTPASLRSRAISHMLMALLAAGLTMFGYLGHMAGAAKVPPGFAQNLLLAADALVGVIAIAILSRTFQDLFSLIKRR